MAVLRSTRGCEPGRVCELQAGSLLLGRNPKVCDVVLDHYAVSRSHARVEVESGGIFIEDLHSRNGVLINGRMIRPGREGRQRLFPSDRVQIATYEFIFEEEASTDGVIIAEETQPKAALTTVGVTPGSEGGRRSKLPTLIGIIESLSAEVDFQMVLPRVMASLFRAFPQAQSGCVLLRRKGRFEPAAYLQRDGNQGPVRVSRGVIAEVVRTRLSLFSRDPSQDSRFSSADSIRDLNLGSLICAPLLDAKGEVIGLIQLENVDGDESFDEEDIQLLAAVARHLEVVVENNRLRDSALQERFRQLIENSVQGILIHRMFKPLFVNEAFAALHGYTAQEIMTMESVLELIAPDQHQRALEHVDARLKGELAQERYEAAHVKRDGTRFWVEKFMSVVDWDGERAVQAAVIDITQRKEAEETLLRLNEVLERRVRQRTQELERSNQDLEQFAYSVSHDLQAPLRTIRSYCQLLQENYGDRLDEEADEYLMGAVEGSKRMKRLLDDLLEYSRATSDEYAMLSVDSQAMLEEATNNLRTEIQEVSAQVTYGPLPTIVADATQLMQVFQNLISNAIKYRGQGAAKIHIHCEDRPREWVFAVSDNGIGVDQRQRDRIFLIFQRLHTSQERPGSGIGLSICQKIVERHGGRIWVESEVGQGSTFYFSIAKKKEGVNEDSSMSYAI